LGITRLVIDSGGLSAIAAKEEVARRILRRAVLSGATVVVPTVGIAESTRAGPADAEINRFLKTVDAIVPLDEPIARAAGALRHATRIRDVADAAVVATADSVPSSAILTSDPSDLRRLALVRSRTKIVVTREGV
jgi:predicted nucleic acid-binding protein